MNRSDIHNVMATAFVAAEKHIANVLALQKNLESAVERDEDYSLLYAALEWHIKETDQWQATIQDTRKKLIAFENAEQFSERWWRKKRKYLYEVFRDNAQQGLRKWLQAYREALIAWELAICKNLVKERFPFPDEAFDMLKLSDQGIQAIEDKDYLQALDMLTSLELQASAQSPLDDTQRATLLVFAGRIYLYEASDTEKAKMLFAQAGALAPDNGLPCAALGSYYHKVGDVRQAKALYRQANELSPTKPDGYIGLGLLAEDQESWYEATDWYNEAIEAVDGEKDIEVALTKLRAPVSGRLYLQLARAFERQDAERALRVVELAIGYGIKCDGNYSEPLSRQIKGKLLEQLGKKTEAAEAYLESGCLFYGRCEYETAVKQFASATKLQPDLAMAYWYWADTLLMQSYVTEAPYVYKDHIEDSLEKWNKASSIEKPDEAFAWVYLTRACICDQCTFLPDTTRWNLWWEAITHVEQAILQKQLSAPIWALLSQFHRSLNNDANALSLTRMVLDTGSEDPDILKERAGILANVGEFIEAEKVISKYLVKKPDDFDSGEPIKADIFLHTQRYKEALTLLDKILERDPDGIRFRDMRAYCYLLLDQSSEAVEEYRWIWNRYSPDESNNAHFYATAAYNIDKIEEAINIIQERFNDPSWEQGKASCMLGLCYLTQQKFGEGEDLLHRGIGQMTNKRQLDDLDRDFAQIEKRALIWPLVDQSRLWSGLNRLKKDIEKQRDKIACPRSPEEEMKQVIKKYPQNSDTGDWAWIGAQATLARIYSEESCWIEATETYRLLLSLPFFPEARIGLTEALNNLRSEGKNILNEYT